MRELCPLVDDVIDEAASLASQLCRQGVPFEVLPVMPSRRTRETYDVIVAAKPRAAMVDFRLTARPGTKAVELAHLLIESGVHAVVLTKDRNVADGLPIRYKGHDIPVYYKQGLISDKAYVEQLIADLGGGSSTADGTDHIERLHTLQDKVLLGTISGAEKTELRTLLARVSLEEKEEAGHIERAQASLRSDLDSVIALIREVTAELSNELKARHEVYAKKRRPRAR